MNAVHNRTEIKKISKKIIQKIRCYNDSSQCATYPFARARFASIRAIFRR